MKPYYDHAGITIYHGDCREVLIDDSYVLITDPPYGVNLGETAGTGGGHGLSLRGYDSYSDTYENFIESIVPRLNEFLGRAKRAAVWTGPHIHEQRKPDVIGGVYCPAGAGRHRWGFKSFLPVLLYGSAPNLHLGANVPNVIQSSDKPSTDAKGHPCPKPDSWLRWLINLASVQTEVVVDPFMGSGTTLRAAKDLGRKAIGIEIEERYCEIAAKRMAQEVLF